MTNGLTAMLKTCPRRATHVSVQPPMSQIRIGAVAVIVWSGTPCRSYPTLPESTLDDTLPVAMNCRNCGAAMELLGARRYFFCRHCGSFHFPDTVDEGVRVLAREHGQRQCGVCKQSLATAVLHDDVDAEYCERCRGVLLARTHFAELVERRRAWASTPPVVPTPVDRRQLARSLQCPGCSASMTTHPYYGPGNVILDTCDRCNLVWLDYGELNQIVDAPGQDRGCRERPPASHADTMPDLLELLANQFGRRERRE
jgi:Zn-finger nucleic acid-binding protein